MEASGRFMEVWKLELWMMPHVAINYATVLKALGKKVDKKWINAAKTAEEMSPPGYPLIRLNVDDIATVIKKMTLEDN